MHHGLLYNMERVQVKMVLFIINLVNAQVCMHGENWCSGISVVSQHKSITSQQAYENEQL